MAAGGKSTTVASSRGGAAVVALVALLAVAAARGAGAAGTVVCNVDADAMKAQCSSYCTAGSTEQSPRKECCDAVRGGDFACLCGYKSMLKYLVKGIDANRAMQIPSKCGIPGAPTQC